jgi:hypothetical protein
MRIKSPCVSAGACSWMFVKRKARAGEWQGCGRCVA